ncbi:RtcB family protein [Aliikangiella sp. IMCC44359]|uniref:RtcB family protein n=1 Tax=Aliikangiella sp. IMCC44359 TaxID=3459125 RepID=UPI00403A8560
MNKSQATYQHWLSEKLNHNLERQSKRLRNAKDIKHVRLMADAHLAKDVCVGCVIATSTLIYPAAIGGDIGCGMLSVPFNITADLITDKQAQKIFSFLINHVPIIKQKKAMLLENIKQLSCEKLTKFALREGKYQLGTLGRGNHFIELQTCSTSGQLWLMIHTGSRIMGPTIRDYHLNKASQKSVGLGYLDINTNEGQAYYNDMQWARHYASINRLSILERCIELFKQLFSVSIDESQMIHCDHNHLEQVNIAGETLLVHRKGACSVKNGEPAIIPGSMGSNSYHVIGKGNVESLYSSSHGAGRCMSRQLAKKVISHNKLSQQMKGIFYQKEKLHLLKEEAPSSYKKIETIIASQKKLITVTRCLSPVLSYKGT